MSVVKRKVSYEQVGARSSDAARPPTEVKYRVVQIDRPTKRLNSLAIKLTCEKDFRTICPGERHGRDRRIQFASRNAESCHLSAGSFPRDTSLWVMFLGYIHQFRQSVCSVRLNVESVIEKRLRSVLNFLFSCKTRRMIG